MPQRGWNVEYDCAFWMVSGSRDLEGENRFMLGAVVLENAANVGQARDAPDEEQEKRNADHAVHDVEGDLVAESRIGVLQLGGRQQRQKLVHEDEESDRQHHVEGERPARHLGFLLVFGRQPAHGDIG